MATNAWALAPELVCGEREAILQDRGAEVRIFTNGSFRATMASEADAREWCKQRRIEVLRVER